MKEFRKKKSLEAPASASFKSDDSTNDSSQFQILCVDYCPQAEGQDLDQIKQEKHPIGTETRDHMSEKHQKTFESFENEQNLATPSNSDLSDILSEERCPQADDQDQIEQENLTISTENSEQEMVEQRSKEHGEGSQKVAVLGIKPSNVDLTSMLGIYKQAHQEKLAKEAAEEAAKQERKVKRIEKKSVKVETGVKAKRGRPRKASVLINPLPGPSSDEQPKVFVIDDSGQCVPIRL